MDLKFGIKYKFHFLGRLFTLQMQLASSPATMLSHYQIK